MQNLAGDKECDKYIRDELERARITVIPMSGLGHEVPYSIGGVLGPFTFKRAWTYWVVRGPMPLYQAQILYAHPEGRRSIRVSGHCGCPAPEKPWIEWYSPIGARLWPQDEYEAEVKQFANSPKFKKMIQDSLDRGEYQVSDNLQRDGSAYVMSYHIDEQPGLLLFSMKVREYDLHVNPNLLSMMLRVNALESEVKSQGGT